jgi:hypothetical protein
MPTKLIVNCETGETSEVELTPEEIAQQEADILAQNELLAAREAKAEAKASAIAKLAALGLTEEEVTSLF